MSRVRVAIPVMRGRVIVWVNKGRPWSAIEQLLLEALTRREWSSKDLAAAARIPRRVVIEAIVRLMRVGWLDLTRKDGAIAFRANTYGIAAATRTELPTAPRPVRRPISYIVDQVTGEIFRNREWITYEEKTLKERQAKEKIVWLKPANLVRGYDPNRMIEVLLDEDEQFLSAEPSGLIRRFVLATVRDGKVEGFPQRDLPDLRKVVLAAGGSYSTKNEGEQQNYVISENPLSELPYRPIHRKVQAGEVDLVLGGIAHRQILEQTIERAVTRVFIHSTFIGEEQFIDLLPLFESAAKRGVRINILWGQNDDKNYVISTKSAIDNLRRNSRVLALENSLVIYPFSTTSHAKLLLADNGKPNEYLAVVGSCNWLSSNFQSYEVSASLKNPQLVGDVFNCLATLSFAHSGIWTELSSELVAIGRSLVEEPASPGNVDAAVLVGPHHNSFVLRARDEAMSRIFVASHRLGATSNPAVVVPVMTAVAARGIDAKIYFNRATGAMHSGAAGVLAEQAALSGVAIQPIESPRLHAKVLAWDSDAIVITSLNWLSADPVDFSIPKEIGVWLSGKKLANVLIKNFDDARNQNEA